ncbi:MAG: hypothetical protein ABR588_10945 [Sphingomicrobium sp.]|nr:hypothetical protein [Sphingomonadales bacterium]
MRILALLLLLLASPLSAQLIVPQVQPATSSPLYRSPSADAASAYITAGQDEPGYRAWYAALPLRSIQVKAFNDYLTTYEVGGIVPTWQLLRTATSWRECGAQPFEVPPLVDWPNVVQTLRYIRDYVVPAVGPVEPVSAYRNPSLNLCAGGAPQSAHQDFHAVDLVPMQPITREHLMSTLCEAHLRRGSDYQVGLGFYAFLRFHVDSTRFRKWGVAAVGEASPCRVTIAHTVTSTSPAVRLPSASSSAAPATPAPSAPQTALPQATPAVDPLAPTPTPH